MPRKKTLGEPSPPKSGKEVRAEIKDYIRNERDTVLMRWRCLEESVKVQDLTKENFEMRQKRSDQKKLPVNIQKFIGTLKRNVRKTIRDKGGTPYSIIRNMFLYWSSSGNGTLTGDQLKRCMNTLGVRMTDSEIDEVVKYYKATLIGTQSEETLMSYDELLSDIMAGEPTVLQFTGQTYFDADDIDMRFTEHDDDFAFVPTIVKYFVEATQNYVMNQMRAEGGTPHHHIRELFTHFDYTQSHGLTPHELMTAATKKMKLSINIDQAKEIVKFYDRKKEGQMPSELFLKDVTRGTKPILEFHEIKKEDRIKEIKSLNANPLMPKPFHPIPNKQLESMKALIRKAVHGMIEEKGGQIGSWLHDAFGEYDRGYSKKISNWKDLQGVMRRLRVGIGRDEALSLIRSYDVNSDGNMHYTLFIKDMVDEDPHFLKTPNEASVAILTGKQSSSARTPAKIAKVIQKFRSAVQQFVKKSQNVLSATNVLYGIFLHHDTAKSGRAPPFVVSNVVTALQMRLTEDEINDIVDWFDTNATHQLDYKSFTQHLYGNDTIHRVLKLPKLNKKAGMATYNDTVSYRMKGETLLTARSNMSLTSARKKSEGKFDDKHATVAAEIIKKAKQTHTGPNKDTSNKNIKERKDLFDMDTMISPMGVKKPQRESEFNILIPNPTMKDEASARNGNLGDGVGGNSSEGKVNPVIESPAIKQARLKSKRDLVLEERKRIKAKLAEVEFQRSKLSDDHSNRKKNVYEQELAKKHEAAYAERIAKRVAAGTHFV